jgi:hypothetical protein
MAHVAQLNESNEVIQVIVVSNDYEPNVEDFASNLFGGTWVQTSYSGSIRKNFAGIGHHYDPNFDAFIAPKCHPEAVLIEATCRWECDNDEHKDKII